MNQTGYNSKSMKQSPEKQQPNRSSGETEAAEDGSRPASGAQPQPGEVGGRDGPDPVRYGDWEMNGRCIDF